MNRSLSPRRRVLSHATVYTLLLIFTAFPVLFYPSPATFHRLDSHWMENSWFGDCPEHIMPNSSMNPRLALLSSELPRSLSSFKVGLHSWNKRKTAFMRTCSSPTYGTALPLLLSSDFVSQHDSPVRHWRYGQFYIWWLKTDKTCRAPGMRGRGAAWDSRSDSRCGSPAVSDRCCHMGGKSQ